MFNNIVSSHVPSQKEEDNKKIRKSNNETNDVQNEWTNILLLLAGKSEYTNSNPSLVNPLSSTTWLASLYILLPMTNHHILNSYLTIQSHAFRFGFAY